MWHDRDENVTSGQNAVSTLEPDTFMNRLHGAMAPLLDTRLWLP